MRWLSPLVSVLLVALPCYWLLGCGLAGPVKTPTPGGLVVFYQPNEKRLSDEKARELDERHAALLKCLPPGAFVRHEPPTFAIEGECDTFLDAGVRVRGRTWINGTRRITLPGSLGAAAHEMAHYYTDDAGHGKGSWPRECGDVIDGTFRRLYPPRKCKGDP